MKTPATRKPATPRTAKPPRNQGMDWIEAVKRAVVSEGGRPE